MGSKGLNKPLLFYMGYLLRSIFFSLALMFTHTSYALTTGWHVDGNPLQNAASPEVLCSNLVAEFSSEAYWRINSDAAIPDQRKFCDAYGNFGQTYKVWTLVILYCPEDTVMDPATGQCVAKPSECAAKIGQSHSFGTDMGQMEACVDKCIVAVDASSSDAITTYKKAGDITKTYWWVTGVFTGEDCAASDGPDSNPPSPTESKSDRDCTPTTTSADGTQVSSCTDTKTEVDNQGCVAKGGSVGSVNGVMQCVAANKGPKATETKTETKTESKSNPDGSKSETTTKKTDQKTCSGAGSCSTNTTTNVNHNNTNADGTKGSESSTCTGSNCTSTGSGDGKGDGKGDGEGQGEGEEGEGPAGPQGTLQKGEQGSFAEGISEWDQRISEVRGELDQKLDQYSGMFKGVFDLNLSTGSGSLPCDNIPVSFGGTSTTLRFCLADYADPLSYLRYALLLGAAALAAIIILRG